MLPLVHRKKQFSRGNFRKIVTVSNQVKRKLSQIILCQKKILRLFITVLIQKRFTQETEKDTLLEVRQRFDIQLDKKGNTFPRNKV